MSVHITVQLATKQHTHSCKGELGKGAAGGDGDSGVSEGSGGDAVVVGKAVVGVQVIRQCACLLPPVRTAVRMSDVCGGLAIDRNVVGMPQERKRKERCLPCGPMQTRWDEHVRVGLPRASGRPYGCTALTCVRIWRCTRRGGWGIARARGFGGGGLAWWWRLGSARTLPRGTSGEDRRGGGGGGWRREAS